MKNLKIAFVFIALIVMASCSDDFVDVKPNNENSEDFFNSEEDYQNALIAAYDLLQSTYFVLWNNSWDKVSYCFLYFQTFLKVKKLQNICNISCNTLEFTKFQGV